MHIIEMLHAFIIFKVKSHKRRFYIKINSFNIYVLNIDRQAFNYFLFENFTLLQ